MFDESGNFLLYSTLLGIKVRVLGWGLLFGGWPACLLRVHPPGHAAGHPDGAQMHADPLPHPPSFSFFFFPSPPWQVVNLVTNRLAKVVGRVENTDRFLQLALYQVGGAGC